MEILLAPGTVWRYVGPDPGRNVCHLVIDLTNAVTTWSEPDAKAGVEISGWSWHGPIPDFLKQFKPVLT